MNYLHAGDQFVDAGIQELSFEEIDQVDGGSRLRALIKAIDWVGRALTVKTIFDAAANSGASVNVGDPMDTKLGINTGRN